MIAILLGLVYLQTGAQLCCLTIQNINGVLFLFLTNLTFPYVFGSIEVSKDSKLPVRMANNIVVNFRCSVRSFRSFFGSIWVVSIGSMFITWPKRCLRSVFIYSTSTPSTNLQIHFSVASIYCFSLPFHYYSLLDGWVAVRCWILLHSMWNQRSRC